MTNGEKKQGMSKGCLVALIVAAVLLIIVIVGGWLIWKNKDDVIKYGVVTSVNSAKTELTNMAEPVVDTTVFFGISDAFLEKFQVDSLKLEEGDGIALFQAVQAYAENKKLDSAIAIKLLDGMITYYPELAEMLPPVPQEYIDSVFSDSL